MQRGKDIVSDAETRDVLTFEADGEPEKVAAMLARRIMVREIRCG